MQKAALVDMLCLQDDISVASSRRSRDNVLQECGWNKEYHNEQIDDSTNGASAFGDLPLVRLGQVDTLQACLDEVGAGPHDQRVRRSEGEAAQGN